MVLYITKMAKKILMTILFMFALRIPTEATPQLMILLAQQPDKGKERVQDVDIRNIPILQQKATVSQIKQ